MERLRMIIRLDNNIDIQVGMLKFKFFMVLILQLNCKLHYCVRKKKTVINDHYVPVY